MSIADVARFTGTTISEWVDRPGQIVNKNEFELWENAQKAVYEMAKKLKEGNFDCLIFVAKRTSGNFSVGFAKKELQEAATKAAKQNLSILKKDIKRVTITDGDVVRVSSTLGNLKRDQCEKLKEIFSFIELEKRYQIEKDGSNFIITHWIMYSLQNEPDETTTLSESEFLKLMEHLEL